MDDAPSLEAGGTHEAEADDDLASLARSDLAAFGLLYERHRLAVYRYLRGRTRTEDAAADLTAETFERALRALPRYRRAGGGFLAWLLRIARNAAIDASRRSAPGNLAADLVAADERDEPEAVAVARETRVALLDAIDRLPEPQREAVLLRYASRLTARQIGSVIGKSETATQKLLSRALASIRESCDVDR
jgi:RNA polymerase sigma-70 factor (ECF subfamily)